VTRATACALVAGIAGAVALADLVATRPRRARRPRARGRVLVALAGLGRRLGAAGAPGDLAARVAAAGTPLGLAPSDVMAAKGAAALVGALAGLPLAAAAPGRLGLLALLAAPGAGFLAPDAWLRRRARRRAATMRRELPDVLDLLRVAVEAGLPVARALGDVGRRHAGLLAGELRATATAIDLGAPRAHALAALPRRAPLPAVGALVAAIDRAERHGAPLSPALAALAAQARAESARALAEGAARAAPKIQLVVALVLVPAVMCIVAAGAVVAFVPQ
jgi:tight adherence protein C